MYHAFYLIWGAILLFYLSSCDTISSRTNLAQVKISPNEVKSIMLYDTIQCIPLDTVLYTLEKIPWSSAILMTGRLVIPCGKSSPTPYQITGILSKVPGRIRLAMLYPSAPWVSKSTRWPHWCAVSDPKWKIYRRFEHIHWVHHDIFCGSGLQIFGINGHDIIS